MADCALTAEPFLGGYSLQSGETSLKEVTDLALVSVTCPLGGERNLADATARAWNLEVPRPGRSEAAEDGSVRLLGMAIDQFFAVLPANGGNPLDTVAAHLGTAGYLTSQTDNWVMLRIEGPLAVRALERVCLIDLAPSAFPDGAVARTVMEHLGAVIVREAESKYLLLSASSSAKSFVHAIETSIANVS